MKVVVDNGVVDSRCKSNEEWSRIVIDNGEDADARAGLQECRGSLIGMRIWITSGKQLYCIVLQDQGVDV